MASLAIVSFGRDDMEVAQALPLLERFDRRYPGRRERMNWWERRLLERRVRKWRDARDPSPSALFAQRELAAADPVNRSHSRRE